MSNTRRTKVKQKVVEKNKSEVLKVFKARTKGQAEYIRTIVENEITFCHGVPGTGKTACAVGLAVQYLMEKRVDKIVITRPIVATSTKPLGALPGGVKEKIDPYLFPIYEELESYFGKAKVAQLIKDGVIVIAPLELMRGSNFHKSFIILDEAQNCTPVQLKMFVTRIGEDSKMVINGDTEQCDLRIDEAGGLVNFIKKLEPVPGIGVAYLTEADIQRNKIIGLILRALNV
jgi:phosphate starvation-inducible PhoH-like protein